MTASKIFSVPDAIKSNTHLTDAQYAEMYANSVANPEAFWAEHANLLEWFKKPTKVKTPILVTMMFP